jgi:3-oxoacyl-(acyl-carrier-protein) synthase
MSTLFGFQALELLSRDPCKPCAFDRDGISIGEAAGFALLDPGAAAAVRFAGAGESSDAHHMSSPHPDGAGAATAMRSALADANLTAEHIDHIHLHGTASRPNDAAEDRAVFSVFGAGTPVSSTKGWTGHTLGAAGIMGALIWGARICASNGCRERRTASLSIRRLSAPSVLRSRPMRLRRVLCNAFGFGGTNCSLVPGGRAMTPLLITGIGICATGMANWTQGDPLLLSTALPVLEPLPRLAPDCLPPVERRRCERHHQTRVSAAVQAVQDLSTKTSRNCPRSSARRTAMAKCLPACWPRCAQPQVSLSPTLFHNSVFNAPSGYWSIGSRSRVPSITVSAGAASFVAGLMEAHSQVCATGAAVLYVAYDAPFPAALASFARSVEPFACALRLEPIANASACGYGRIEKSPPGPELPQETHARAAA